MKFKGYKELDFKLQVKFYPAKESKHISWGQKLNSIALECTVASGNSPSYVDNKCYH